jgi:hypothetical protein
VVALAGIVLFVFVGALILAAVFAAGLSAVYLAVLSRFEQTRRRPAHSRADFVRKLVRDVSRRAVRDLDDVHRSYRRFVGADVMRSSHLEELDEFLQGAMRQIALTKGASENGAREKVQFLHDLRAANHRALEVEQMCAPFSGTPEHERGLLKELLVSPLEDEAAARAKLSALAKAIRFRQDALERLRLESDRSLQLARWGWYGTLTLAILLALLGFVCLGI